MRSSVLEPFCTKVDNENGRSWFIDLDKIPEFLKAFEELEERVQDLEGTVQSLKRHCYGGNSDDD